MEALYCGRDATDLPEPYDALIPDVQPVWDDITAMREDVAAWKGRTLDPRPRRDQLVIGRTLAPLPDDLCGDAGWKTIVKLAWLHLETITMLGVGSHFVAFAVSVLVFRCISLHRKIY